MAVRYARIGVYVVVVAMFAGGLWLTDYRFDQALQAVAEQREIDRAQGCIGSWEGRLGVRSLIDGLVSASAGTDPARVAAFREDMARRLPDPDCDLEAAQRRVAQAEGG